MEKFYCKIWCQSIYEKQCYLIREPSLYYKNSYCLECPKHKEFILSKLEKASPELKNIDLPKYPTEEKRSKDRISKSSHQRKKVKKTLSGKEEKSLLITIKKLEESLIDHSQSGPLAPGPKYRLTPELRREEYLLDIFQSLCLHNSFWGNPNFLFWQILRLNGAYQEFVDKFWKPLSNLGVLGGYINFFFRSVPPFHKESIDEWIDSLHEDCITCDDKLFYFLKYYDVPYPPTPYWICFPLPILFNKFLYLSKDEIFRTKAMGRPVSWAKDLAVYTLSQSGKKDTEIAQLLYGIKKSTEYYPKKHPILSQIQNMKKTVKKYIDIAYPFRE